MPRRNRFPAPLAPTLAALLLAACNAPDPEPPEVPPTPQATGTVDAPSATPRPTRPIDRTPATPDLPVDGTDNPVWKQAAERGIAFRGLGQEPGWYVEVGSGETPALHAELDYGERVVDVAEAIADGTQGFHGATADGTEVVVRTREGPCFDGMSGHRFPVAVELTVGGQAYQGCGAYL